VKLRSDGRRAADEERRQSRQFGLAWGGRGRALGDLSAWSFESGGSCKFMPLTHLAMCQQKACSSALVRRRPRLQGPHHGYGKSRTV
jgi:hypothetical protein